MAHDIIYTDGAGFARMEDDDGKRLVIMEFSRQNVEAGLTGDAVDRLMHLTDTKSNTIAYEDLVCFFFSGYDFDPREIPDIPECRKFFQAVTELFPYWLHFLIKAPETLNLAYSLLCQVTPRHGDFTSLQGGPHSYEFLIKDIEQVRTRLNNAVKNLYAMHDIPDEHYDNMMLKVQALEQFSYPK